MTMYGRILQGALGLNQEGAFATRHRWLFAGFWVNTIAQFMFSSILAVHLHRQGIAPLHIGAIMLLFHVCMRCTGPLCGALIDVYGPRICLALGTVLAAIGYVTVGFAQELWYLAGSLAVLGFGLGLDHLCRSTLLVQVSATKDEGNRALAFYYVVFNLAASCGPLLSALATYWNVPLKVLMCFAGGLCLATGAAFVLLFPFPARGRAKSGRRPSFRGLGIAWADRRFRSLVLSLPMIWFLFSFMHVSVPVLLMEGTGTRASAVSGMFSLNAVMVVLLGYRVNRRMVHFYDRRGRSKLDGIAVGATCMGLALFSLVMAVWLPNITPFLFMAIFTLGELCFIPMIEILVNESIQDQDATPGPYFGLATLAWGVGGGLSHVLGGLVIQLGRSYGFALFPVVFGLASLVIAVVFWRLSNSRSVPRQRQAKQEEAKQGEVVAASR